MRPVAILRPEPAASATLERARRAGLNAFSLPLFDIVALDWTAPDPANFDGVLLTSANAVRHGGSGLDAFKALPAYCVGSATSDAARDAGFQVAATGSGGAADLLQAIGEQRLFHPCGRDRIAIPQGPASITSVPVYESVIRAAPQALERLAGAVAVVHSPRAARRLAALGGAKAFDPAAVMIAAISPAAAAAAGGGWQDVRAAADPSDRALLALAAELCNSGGGE